MNGRERILSLLNGEQADRLPFMPITMMFAADQLGVKYRDYISDFRVLGEAQLLTAERFDFDYVSVISDPAREAADLGAAIEWFDDQPPALQEDRALFADKAALARTTVEGWVEGPCAMGADLRGINTLMLDFYDDPGFVRDLFAFAVEMELGFAKAQIEAGADLIGVGDAAASLVGPRWYNEFVWPLEKKLVDGIHAMRGHVRLHICGNTRKILEGMGRLGCEIVDLDWMSPLQSAREQMGAGQVLLGNIDPVAVLRNKPPDAVAAAIADCHRQAGDPYIVSAGCEVCRDTPPENVRALHTYAVSNRPGARR